MKRASPGSPYDKATRMLNTVERGRIGSLFESPHPDGTLRVRLHHSG